MDKDKFKIVYVAPMKALVKEMVDSFGKVRLVILWLFYGYSNNYSKNHSYCTFHIVFTIVIGFVFNG